MNLKVEIIRRAVKDLGESSSKNKQSSLLYLHSNNFLNDCKSSAVDSVWVRGKVETAMNEDGARRKHLINKLSNDLLFYC